MSNKIATMTWDTYENQVLPAIDSARTDYIYTEVSNGNTNGILNVITDSPVNHVSQRTWYSAESAQAWKDFITQLAQENGASVDVVITDAPG